MSRKWLYLRFLQILLDFGLIFGSFLLAYFLRVGWIFSSNFEFSSFALTSFFASFLWLGFLLFSKYYRVPPRSGLRSWFDITLIIIGGVAAVSSLVVIYFFNSELFFSRLISIYALLIGIIALFISRTIFHGIFRFAKKYGHHNYQTLIIGTNKVSAKLIRAIKKNPYAPYDIIGAIDPYGLARNFKETIIFGKLDQLEKISQEKKITAIIQCDAFEHTINLISFCTPYNYNGTSRMTPVFIA